MHCVFVMQIQKICELYLTNVQTLVIQVCLGPTLYVALMIFVSHLCEKPANPASK